MFISDSSGSQKPDSTFGSLALVGMYRERQMYQYNKLFMQHAVSKQPGQIKCHGKYAVYTHKKNCY